MISFIVAMDKNRVIGRNNQLPWHLPEDLRYFKRVTMGHPIIMGRKTFESIGRPLPGRENIIVTRQTDYSHEQCTVLHGIDELYSYVRKKEDEEYFVIGGAEMFKEVLPIADRLYITYIDEEFEGDTFFPAINLDEWEMTSSEEGLQNEKNPYDYKFLIYNRKK